MPQAAAASLVLKSIAKSYGTTRVLENISLSLAPREMLAFLGPSGSGKSTLLRIIAGLESADSGEVWLEGRRIDRLAPGVRGVAMVFQHYALYPHMTGWENMAFGLKNAGVPRPEIDARIAQAAQVLEIESQLDKKPGQMSGGQRQRVAIGRAIVKQPRLFLLDEPLSNLDAALRTRTRLELAQLRRRVDAALIMVTHDQAEAMTLADRIVVMNDRRIQQVGTPMEIYVRPANAFVARFVGSPAMTLVPVSLVAGNGPMALVRVGSGVEVETRVPRACLPATASLSLGLRPEHIAVATAEDAASVAETMLVERLGDRTLVYARLANGPEVIAQAIGFSGIAVGDRIGLKIAGTAAHLFDEDGRAYHALPAP